MNSVKDPRLFERVNLNVDIIDANPLNPRKSFDDDSLQELAKSIREVGILQPLIITEGSEPGRYLLVAGERRLRAAKLIGLSHVPVKYLGADYDRDWRDKKTQMALMLIENLQREDLDPIEEARAFATLTQEHGWKQTELAEKLGISQSHIANRIRLLVLPESIQEGISEGRVTATVGKELVTYAKVPGVAEALDEAMSDGDDNGEGLIYTAKNSAYGSVMPLHNECYPEPEFDLRDCKGCEYRVMLPGRWPNSDKRLPWCTDTRCWEEKQDAALREIAEKAKQQAIEAGEEIIELNSLPGNAYESLDAARFNTIECTQCEHRRSGRNSWMDEGEYIDICLNPECFKAKKSTHDNAERQREKALKEAHEERKESLIAGFFPQALFEGDPDKDCSDFRALVYMVAQVINVKGKEDTVCDRYGWKVPDDLGWSEGLQYFVQQLATLTTAELLRVIYFVMLKQTRHDDVIFEAVYGESGVDES